MSGDKKRKLSEGWKSRKIEDICKVQSGGTPLTSCQEYYGGDIKWAITEDLTNANIYIEETLKKITPLGLKNSSSRLFPENTVLFAMYGSIGRCAITKVPMSTNQAIAGLIPKNDKELNSLYLYFYMSYGKELLLKNGRTGTQTNINSEMIKNLNILLPPTFTDQLAIASDLERRMAHVETMRAAALRQKEAIAAMQGAILREVFSYEEGDELPVGWKWKTIKDVIENNIQVFNPENYDNEKFIYIDISSVDNVSKKILNANQVLVKDAPSRAKSILKENDIIISTVRPNLNAVILVDKSRVGNICSSGFCVIRLKNGYHAPYFFYYLTSPYFVEAVSNMVQGAMYPAISNDDVKDFSIPLPPSLSDQIAIAAELERKIAELEKARQTAQRQVEAIEALPGAILREVFDFEEENTGS